VIAVGDHYFGQVPELLVRASCPFGGGVGGSHQELCGVLGGGTLLLGALWGRASSAENDDFVRNLVCRFREQFIATAGNAQCQAILDGLPDEKGRCLPIVIEGTRILVKLIEEAAKEHPFTNPALLR